MDLGVIGGFVGGVLGVAGGAAGTYLSIKNTLGPRERAFMTRAALGAWLAIAAFLAGLHLLPEPQRWLLWIPYGLGLGLGIRWCNRRQLQIRRQEAAAAAGAAGT